jgi:hypothetical protein
MACAIAVGTNKPLLKAIKLVVTKEKADAQGRRKPPCREENVDMENL